VVLSVDSMAVINAMLITEIQNATVVILEKSGTVMPSRGCGKPQQERQTETCQGHH